MTEDETMEGFGARRLATWCTLGFLLAISAVTSWSQPDFDPAVVLALNAAEGGEYRALRDEFLQSRRGEVRLLGAEVLDTGIKPVIPSFAGQIFILDAWLLDADKMRSVQQEVASWSELPTFTTQSGRRTVALSAGGYAGREDLVAPALLEMLLKFRETSPVFTNAAQTELFFQTLGATGSSEVVPSLLALAENRDEELDLRLNALDALGAMRDTSLIDRLAAIAREDPDEAIRQRAYRALGQIPSQRSLHLLRSFEQSETDPGARLDAEIGADYLEAYLDLQDGRQDD